MAAADVAYSRATHRMHAAVVAVQLPGFEVVETVTATQLARFPYIPGLFSFRLRIVFDLRAIELDRNFDMECVSFN